MSSVTLVYTKLSGTVTNLFSWTVMLQLIGGSSVVNNCSLGQVEENTIENDGKALEHDGFDAQPLEFDSRGELAGGIDSTGSCVSDDGVEDS